MIEILLIEFSAGNFIMQ